MGKPCWAIVWLGKFAILQYRIDIRNCGLLFVHACGILYTDAILCELISRCVDYLCSRVPFCFVLLVRVL